MGTGEGAVPSAFNPQRPGGSVESPRQGQEARVDVKEEEVSGHHKI